MARKNIKCRIYYDELKTQFKGYTYNAMPADLRDAVENFYEPGYDYTRRDFWESYSDNSTEPYTSNDFIYATQLYVEKLLDVDIHRLGIVYLTRPAGTWIHGDYYTGHIPNGNGLIDKMDWVDTSDSFLIELPLGFTWCDNVDAFVVVPGSKYYRVLNDILRMRRDGSLYMHYCDDKGNEWYTEEVRVIE